jgi:F-type H+-transporting ATPase subunit epsilon
MAFLVKIFTSKKKYFEGQVDLLSVYTQAGQLGILTNHTPLVSILTIGPMHMKINKKTFYYAVSKGVLTVKKNETVLLVDAIEKSDEIDFARAKEALERAEKRLSTKTKDIDVLRARIALERAKNRLRVAKEFNEPNTN